MFSFFHSLGTDSVSRQFLKIRCIGFDTEEAQSFIMHIETSSWPWALFWSKDLIILTISSTQNFKDKSLFLVSKFIFTETLLSLNIGEHCLAKKIIEKIRFIQKNQLQVFYLLVVVVSVESYCLLQMFSRWLGMFLGLFLGHLVY